MKENNIKFTHQSLCNPPKSSILVPIYHSFPRGAPHLTMNAVIKYLPPSPATSKAHMKQPQQGLGSMTPKIPSFTTPTGTHNHSMPNLNPHVNLNYNFNDEEDLPSACANLIDNFDCHSIANIFCFGAFANKITNVAYNGCTRDFPFTSLDRNVCFFVMYY